MKTISSHSKTSNPFNITEPVTREKKKLTPEKFYQDDFLSQSASFKVREPLSKTTIKPSPKKTYFRKLKGKITLVNFRNFKIKG